MLAARTPPRLTEPTQTRVSTKPSIVAVGCFAAAAGPRMGMGALEGGDSAAGKASNVEIDRVAQHYFAAPAMLGRETLPVLTTLTAKEAEQRAGKTHLLCFQLFLR
ncbi:hypothetical protein CGC20_37965 [Leishmania donovani]|uniref:Uncharacterized protein n=1 Tax=Leishmania donovani TaxID=5661 RepID=A0A504Y7X8_LEIDO|nr:hypothetical protein CGC21_3760 [Leishmania donovani]TPP55148.1 hypothetical protein CGC20_37965 [Leishmania donovani]